MAATLPSSNAAAMDRRNLEQLMLMMAIHSLLPKEGAADDDAQLEQLKEIMMEFSMTIVNKGDQSAVSKLLLAITQRLLDAQLRLRDGGENEGGVEVSSSASDHQLMETAAAAKKKEKAAAAAKMKKKRNKRNKAAAKHKGTKRMSWLGGGIISLLMMAVAFGSITSLSHIPQSDGSSEGNKAPPTLPPSTSTSLRQRDLQSINNVASASPSSVSPFAVVVQAPIFSPTPSSSPTTSSSPTISPNPTELCFDKPNWEDIDGFGCKFYENADEPGCPNHGSLYDGGMGVANDNCCYCGGGSHTLSSTTSPKPSISPTKSSSPSSSPSSAPSMCKDTEGWYDGYGYDCSWYEVVDVPGCPDYGNLHSGYTSRGVAKDNCCYCENDTVSTVSPTKAPSSSGTCVDTEGWEDKDGMGCVFYEIDAPGCPFYVNDNAGEMGPASENCCYCKDPSCEDYNSKCQDYARDDWWWTNLPDRVKGVCDEAASCSSCETADHVKIVTNPRRGFNETVGLYNECKCDFWLRLCEDTRKGDACDYAAEYCCGDYRYWELSGPLGEEFVYLNSPLCYCDFFKYVQNEFGHTLKPKALNINKEFSNPCDQDTWEHSCSWERESLQAIYEITNGRNWKNNDGWMSWEDYGSYCQWHCQWYGISCDDEGHVTSIDLRGNNLEGQFPVFTRNVDHFGNPKLENDWIDSKYGLANLRRLKTLDLSNNKLTGTIEYLPLYNLYSLTHFDVSGNQLRGEVDALVATSLTHADFSNNSFTAMRRFQKYKVPPLQTLRYCDVSNNAIQQNATDLLENIPPNIEQFIASNNRIYGLLPASLNNLPKLRQFSMTSNALSGDLPRFTESFATLQELDVSSQTNGFNGTIPADVWRSLSLKILNLAGNWLTGTIPSVVGNLAVLEVFNVSSNLLHSWIPSELGMLEGSLKRLGLSNNMFTGTIPSQIGQLQGASVFLKDNHFYNSSTSAPLRLCLEREVEEFDLENDTTLCPPERNSLSGFYDSAKGAEWTDRSLWLDEYESYCDWKGVICDENKNHVIELNLSNNGLSGRLHESIGNLTYIEVLDLSDNDIKGSIPTELGLLSNLTYLRLSYNAFTGEAPKELGELTKLKLLQLQSNRITNMSIIPPLDDSLYNKSTFVTDCGVPSAFDEALKCEHCTMCCNANDDCYPQEKTQVSQTEKAAITFACFIAFCCIMFLSLYKHNMRKNRGITLTTASETRLKEDDKYALSKIGKDSVYSYFVTGEVWVRVMVRTRTLTLTGWWWAAFVTFCIQIAILVVFIMASEAKLQQETIDIQFTWKCPRDTYVCKDKNDLNEYGWVIFSVLMIVFLAKDMIGACKLIYHSAKIRHSLKSRIRYFFGGMCLCSITLFALYVSIIYNKAIATSNTEIIVNSVIVLFVMEMDEYIFEALEAANEKWTAHAAEDTSSDTEARSGSIITEMKDEIALQREQITSQQEDLKKLRELVEKLLESQAASAAATNATTNATTDSESATECEGDTNAREMDQDQSDEIIMPHEAKQNIQEPQAASATPDSRRDSDTEEDLQE